MSSDVVDFRNPNRVPEDIGQMFSKWQQSAKEAIELRWGRVIPGSITVSPVAPAPVTGTDLRTLKDIVSYRVDLVKSKRPTIFVLGQSLALNLVRGMLGDSVVDDDANSRDLTAIEQTCLDFLLDEFRMAIQSSQAFRPPQQYATSGRTRLKELHSEFPVNATNTSIGFQIDIAGDCSTLQWIIPQDAALEMISQYTQSNNSNSEASHQLQELVLAAHLDLAIQLGTCDAPLTQLANLKPGDVIILDQQIHDPITATIGGLPIFRGWGTRIGRQQAFQIAELLEQDV